jgi:DNA-binding NtrC family response regulator
MYEILVVDDEEELREDLVWAAQEPGRNVTSTDSAEQAIKLIHDKVFDVIVTDLRMKREEAGLEVLRVAKEKDVFVQVIVVTAYGTPEISVETMRLGAFDYLERNAPGTDTLAMVKYKIGRALDFRKALLSGRDLS